jgi:hypothetical protein
MPIAPRKKLGLGSAQSSKEERLAAFLDAICDVI